LKESRNNRNFDLSYLKKLGKDDGFLLMLVNLFIDSSEADLELFDKYYKEKNWDQLGDLAHKLRSRTQHFKMVDLASSLKEIEMQCQKQKDNEKFKSLVEQTKSSYLLILNELKEESLTLSSISKG
jgi:HPt (histidine-containing phosphotransfer) domain-containing protein